MTADIVTRLEAELAPKTPGGGSAELQRALLADALAEIRRLRAVVDGLPRGGSPAYTGPVILCNDPLTVEVGKLPEARIIAAPGGGNGGYGYWPASPPPEGTLQIEAAKGGIIFKGGASED